MTEARKKPLILVTNDDGYKAKGIQQLTEVAKEFGEVIVLAASESQSGMSHAITIKNPLRYRLLEQFNGLSRYVVRGTPVDGVKLALNSILDRKPDLILSGINHGSNASSSVVYSGTMAAVIEGAIHKVPSIGFSLLDYGPDADFASGAEYISRIIARVLEEGLPEGICLNVNIPVAKADEIKGVRICRQADGYWKEKFEEHADPRGAKYFWLTGSYTNREEEASDTDEWALKHNYISIVPVNSDYTAHDVISRISSWEGKISK